MSPQSDPTYGLVVIGSGPAGVHAAVAYVDAGGAGRVCLVAADSDHPYQRPPLSKEVLAGEEPPEVTPLVEDDEAEALAQVELRTGVRVESLDTESRVLHTDDGELLAYDRLVVATGSHPRELPGAQPGSQVFALRSLDDARRLSEAVAGARSAVVVGSGFIGCEAAASLAARGLSTTLVTPESAPQVARLGEWAGARLAQWLTAVGVELRTGVQVERVEAPATVRLDDGTTLETDVVVAAVGVDQAQDFLEQSGIPTEEGRLLVDEQLRTADPHVWAAGDVARGHHDVAGRHLSVEHWGDAMTMGALAGRNAAASGPDAVGEASTWSDPPGFWSSIGEHTLKYSAWGDGHDQEHPVDHGDGAFTVWYADAAGELVGVLTHERDEDYERGGELLAVRARLEDAAGSIDA